MSSQGHIEIYQRSDPSATIHVYAYQSGGIPEAVNDLTNLAELLFSAAKANTQKSSQSPWFYHHCLDLAKEKHRQDPDFPEYWDEWFAGLWRNLHCVHEVSTLKLAHWLSWLHFDRWYVIPNWPNKRWVDDDLPADAAPDLLVRITEDLAGYFLSFPDGPNNVHVMRYVPFAKQLATYIKEDIKETLCLKSTPSTNCKG